MDIEDVSKRPMIFGKSVNPSAQETIMANDHEASSGLFHIEVLSTKVVSSKVDSYSKEEAAALTLSREGVGDQEAEGQTVQSVQTHGPSG